MRATMRAVAVAAVMAVAAADDSCTFQTGCDYGKGSRQSAPAATKEICCMLCSNRPGCAAGIFSGNACWFKTEKQVQGGCQKSPTAIACMVKSIKPGPPPPPPPTPPPPPPTPAAPCATFKTQKTCPKKRCTWSSAGTCIFPPPPPPLPVVPPMPPPACGAGETPVNVFVMMGQSNMLGMGRVAGTTNGTLQYAVQTEHKYPYLWDTATNTWSVSKNVRNVAVMGSGGITSGISLHHNEFMTANMTKPAAVPGMSSSAKATIGPELGIGYALGQYTADPVMTLKSCIGDRALGWDLLPPGAPGYNFDNDTYAAYHQSPMKWPEGTKPVPIGWAAGLQYDGDTWRAYQVLKNLSTFYPGAKCYKVAGFFWWQGDKDSRDKGLSSHYEENLVLLIKQLRIQYGAPDAKFVTASLGQTVMGSTSGDGLILDAMKNVADGTKYPEFKGNVAWVYTHPLLHTPGSSGGHYGKDAETYMNVGQAMGEAMVGLLKGGSD